MIFSVFKYFELINMNFKLSRLKSNSPFYSVSMAMLFLGTAVRMFNDAHSKFNKELLTGGGEFVSQNKEI